MNVLKVSLLTALLFFITAAARAEFQVNTYTTNFQGMATIASDADGDFVVVWQSSGSNYGDTAFESIQRQRFNSSGAFIGSQFQVNTYTSSHQTYPDVGAADDGKFVVVWQSFGSNYGDTSNTSIQGQRYGKFGGVNGSQFQVNTYTTSIQKNARAAVSSTGDFMVVWLSYGSYVDPDYGSIQGQRYASNGSLLGSQFQVNTYTTSDQTAPDICVDDTGNFVVVWQSVGSSFNDTDWSIQGQRVASNGTFLGSQFQVNTYTTSNQRFPAISSHSSGDFVVVWQSYGSHFGDTSSESIQGQRFASNGSFLGSQFQVNTYTTSNQLHPEVTICDTGDFVVVWQSAGSNHGDLDLDSIQGQRFAYTGNFVESQFQVNTYTTLKQNRPAVSAGSNAKFVVVWRSQGSFDSDTSNYSIQGRQYTPTQAVPVFSPFCFWILPALLGFGGLFYLFHRRGRLSHPDRV